MLSTKRDGKNKVEKIVIFSVVLCLSVEIGKFVLVFVEDDASPEHASSADVGAPAAAHADAPGHARPPPNAAPSAPQG